MGYLSDALNRPDDGPSNAPTPPPPYEAAPLQPESAQRPPAHAMGYDALPGVDTRRSYRMADHVQRTFTPTIAVDERVVAATDPSSVMTEEYRAIRTGILARWQHRRHLVHTITSATPQEGKTITSLNLSMTFAELRNRRTLLIEADLRLPRFRTLLGLPEGRGLIGLLENQVRLSDVAQTIDGNGLDVVCAGGRASNQTIQLLSSTRMTSLLKEVRQRYDHVIIDTPPVVEFADAGVLGAISDDVLLVVRMNQTPQPVVDHAIRALNSYNAPVAGLIATDQTRSQRRYYYKYDYRHRSGYAQYRLDARRSKAA